MAAWPAGSSPKWPYVSENLPIRPRHTFCTDVGSAVRPRHAGDSWFDRARSALSNQVSATSWLPHHEPGEVQNHQHSGIRCGKRPPSQKRWSDSSLQVEDPKASGTPTSLANTFATFTGSATTMTAHSIKHHGLCTLTKALARLRSDLLSRPALVVSIFGTIQQRWRAVMDGICSLEPQRTRLRSLGQSRELQLPRTTASAPCRFGHSGAMPAARTGEIQRPTACPRPPQRWG